MPIEAHLSEDDVDRGGLEPRHLGEVDTSDPVQMGAEIKSRCVALGGADGWSSVGGKGARRNRPGNPR